MKKQILIITGFASAMLLGGCSSTPFSAESAQQSAMNKAPVAQKQVIYQEVHTPAPVSKPEPVEPVMKEPVAEKPEPKSNYKQGLIKISGIGYGAASTYEGYTPGQRRLLAIRASKLDAYRALAEQLFGIKIDSNTSVSTLMAKNDSFRARINAVVRGARVVSITPMADANYETVLEVYIDRSFFNNAFIYSSTNGSMERAVDVSQVCSQGMNCSTLAH